MHLDNVKIYDLEESIIASGYPMRVKLENSVLNDKDIKRCEKLSKASQLVNGAHGQFLSGIIVSFDLTCSNKMWVEMERYKFINFVSSQSTMHCITKFDLNQQYNKYVDNRIVTVMKEKVDDYNKLLQEKDTDKAKEKYLEILYNNPAGFELTARLTTNYRCLKNIYLQRYDHRLPEWREFCNWIETLPYFNELIKPQN